jgi:hypothetical protein
VIEQEPGIGEQPISVAENEIDLFVVEHAGPNLACASPQSEQNPEGAATVSTGASGA